MTQEKLIRERIVVRTILLSITIIALVVFIGLYTDEKRHVQEAFTTRYEANLERVQEDILSYLEAEGDYEMRYTRLLTDMSTAKEFAFLIDNFADKQIIVNEMYTILLKYPEQMHEEEKLKAMYTAVGDILNHLDQGYVEAKELVNSIDKLGH
ncbi:MAG: hypothetical protein IJ906_12730 [Oscillospiraceae bacterium]|nr:hypothetical protein [Oscillospiraceae bacterium]